MNDIENNMLAGGEHLLEAINSPIFVVDKAENLVYANTVLLDFLSIDFEQLKKEGIYTHLASEQSGIYAQMDREVILDGDVLSFEGVAKKADGKQKEVVYQKSPLFDDGNVIGVVTLLELREAFNEMKAALAKSESQRHAILEGYPGVLALFNAEGLIWVSENGSLLFDKQLGIPFASLFNKETGNSEAKKLLDAVLGGKKTSLPDPLVLNRTESEEDMYLELSGLPVQSVEPQEVNSAIIICTDVTEKYTLEKQLRHAQKMEAIGTLAGGVAHDFNNVLTPIMGYAEIIRMKMRMLGWENDDVTEYIEQILRAARRAKGLVEQILTFSRSSEQRESLLYLHPIVKEVLKLMRVTLPSTIEIKEEIDENCGVVFVDPVQIHQVLINLCTNSSHAIQGGHGKITVTLKTAEENYDEKKWIELSVSDTGCGIEPGMVDRIFEPYFTTREKEQGTGMGLAMVHGIIKRQGGRIEVESELGEGTVFRLLFPVSQKKEGTLNQIVTLDDMPGGDESILLVDDEEQVVEVTGQLLESLGYDVTGVTRVEDALSIIEKGEKKFSLMLTDLIMPGMTGVELALAVKRLYPEMAMILFTGNSDQYSREDAEEAGIGAFCLKPVSLTDLSLLIRKSIDEMK